MLNTTRGISIVEKEQLCSQKAGDNTHSPGPSLVNATHCHSLGISYKLLPQQRADNMNLWLKDGAKKLVMILTRKQEAEKNALLHPQGTPLHL